MKSGTTVRLSQYGTVRLSEPVHSTSTSVRSGRRDSREVVRSAGEQFRYVLASRVSTWPCRTLLPIHACFASKKMRVAHDAATGMSIVPDLSPEPQLEIRKGSAPQTPDPGPGPLTPLILQNFSCNSASEAEGSAAPFIVPGGSTAFYAGGNCDRSESTNLLSIKGLCAGPSWP